MDREPFYGVAASLIWQARTQAGLSQAALAERAGMSQPHIAAYERGRREPTLPVLMSLLAAAGFDLRTRLAPRDTHDEDLAAWEQTLAEDERTRARSRGIRLVTP